MTRLSQGVVLIGGLLTAVALLPAGTTPAVAALVGSVFLVVGAHREWQTGTNLGGALLFCGLVYAGALGLAPGALVVATIGAVVAYDSGVTALGLTGQLDARAGSRRAEMVSVGGTVVAAAGVGGVVVLAYSVGNGVVPPAAVIPVTLGALLVAAGLSPRTAD
jgi:hypothetical protein